MNYILNNEDEKSMIKFIGNFQYLDPNNAKIFFSSKKYYKKRITTLVENKYLKRIKSKLVLDKFGIEYCKLNNYEYNKLNRNKKYLARLLYISNFAVHYYNCKEIQFIPSFNMKDKQAFTLTSRKFIRCTNYRWHRTFNISHITGK